MTPPLTYLKILRAGSGSLGVSVRVVWLECRLELRNQSVGWVRAVERLRNGGVPRNPVFLMPETRCIRYMRRSKELPPSDVCGAFSELSG